MDERRSPSMKYVHLRLREPPSLRNPMHTFVVEHEAMAETRLLNWNVGTGPRDVLLFRVVGAMEPYVVALSEPEFVSGYETARIDDESFYVYVEHETREADGPFREPFEDHRVLPIPPIVYHADGTTRVELVGRTAEVQAAIEGFDERIDVEIDEVGEYERALSAHSSLLTDRQREALRVATEAGYYEVPRSGSVTDVADALDCAESTAATHLRKAEGRLVRQVVTAE
jgi:predicted DNA binding protein